MAIRTLVVLPENYCKHYHFTVVIQLYTTKLAITFESHVCTVLISCLDLSIPILFVFVKMALFLGLRFILSYTLAFC